MATKFTRMNGLGNDFLIHDARGQSAMPDLSKNNILKLCSRENAATKGCDQLIIMKDSDKADVMMLVFNSDGGEVYACGNASRCVVSLLYREGKDAASIETKAGILQGSAQEADFTSVDMGKPVFEWNKIPLSDDMDTNNLPVDLEGFSKPFGVSMGNPHMVFTTDKNVADIDVKGLGAPLEHHPLFPERVNVGFAQIVDKNNMNLRVFERGAGETLACGTGACAAAVAAISRGLCDRVVNIKTRGGNIIIEWRENDGHVIMTGPAELEGVVEA